MAENNSIDTKSAESAASPHPPPPPAQKAPRPARASVWDIYYPRKYADHNEPIYVAGFPEIILLWPTMAVMLLCAFLQGVVNVSPSFLGWAAVAVLFFNLLVFVQEFDQKRFLIVVLALISFFLLVWIVNLYGFSFIKDLARWILGFSPQFSTDAYLMLGLALLVLLCWGLIVPLFDYWKLEQNEFVHFTQPIGKDLSIARAGCSVAKEIPDVIECVLTGGGGDLTFRRDNQTLATVRNVPFLGRRMDAIDHMLSETRVIIDKGA